MRFELTDLLICPRCGPAHGLVLLVREVYDRRVLSGWLGCPACRVDYPVREGIADLRADPAAGSTVPALPPPYESDELALKILALSGLAGERGTLLLGERLAHVASEVAERAPELDVIAIGSAPGLAAEGPGVSWILADAGLPVADGVLRCVAIAPAGDREIVVEAARCVGPGGRLLLFDAGEDDIEEAKRGGLKVLAAEAGIAVAERRAGSLPVLG